MRITLCAILGFCVICACAGSEKLLSSALAEDSTTNLALNDTNRIWTTNRIDYHWTSIGVSHVLTTNVSERWPTHIEPDQEAMGKIAPLAMFIGKQVPDPNPTNKWIRTTIKRQTFVDFTVEGTPFRGLLKEETLFDKEVEWVLERKDTWLEKNTFPASGK